MTLKEALEATAEIIGAVSVPVALQEQIGTPLAAAHANLMECIRAVSEAEKPGKEAEDAGAAAE